MRDEFRRSALSMSEQNAQVLQRQCRTEMPATPERILPADSSRPPEAEPTDHSLIGRSRGGDQDAATVLYARYARWLTTLVRRRCSTMLASCAGVDDIVQSVFGSFFRRIGQNHYDVPDGDELWKLLWVIAMNKIRTKAVYYHAAKRDAHRTVRGAEAEKRLVEQASGHDSASEHMELALKEILERLPAQNQLMAKLRLDGYEVDEVARATGRSRRSVERILQETRQKLRELLREEN